MLNEPGITNDAPSSSISLWNAFAGCVCICAIAVIPDYGYIKSENTDNWAVYRYSNLKWKWISNYRKRKIFHFV